MCLPENTQCTNGMVYVFCLLVDVIIIPTLTMSRKLFNGDSCMGVYVHNDMNSHNGRPMLMPDENVFRLRRGFAAKVSQLYVGISK